MKVTTKQKIINAATRLVVEQGVKATTMRDVAARAEISPGTLTYHFPSREALFFEVLVQYMAKQDDRMMKIMQLQDKQLRHEMLAEFFSPNPQNLIFMELHYYLIGCSVARGSELYLPMREKFNQWKNQFKDIAPHAKEKTPAQLEADAQLLYAVVNGFSMSSLYNDGSFNERDLAQHFENILDSL